ncbi:hypothetical protein [Abyssibacter profundi]|nr:hypothetical protein [Abyssibacter profundi]
MRDTTGLIDMGLREYLDTSVREAMAHQQLEATGETVVYLVEMLSGFVHAERVFETTPDGVVLQPLAGLYQQAVEAPSPEARNEALQRMGDLALFIAGIFPEWLERRQVGLRYYVSMGGSAYSCLRDIYESSRARAVFRDIFGELSEKFPRFVDVLHEVSERSDLKSDADVVQLYTLWAQTGSQRAARQLARLGIQPVAERDTLRPH